MRFALSRNLRFPNAVSPFSDARKCGLPGTQLASHFFFFIFPCYKLQLVSFSRAHIFHMFWLVRLWVSITATLRNAFVSPLPALLFSQNSRPSLPQGPRSWSYASVKYRNRVLNFAFAFSRKLTRPYNKQPTGIMLRVTKAFILQVFVTLAALPHNFSCFQHVLK